MKNILLSFLIVCGAGALAAPAVGQTPASDLALQELWRIGGPDDEDNLLGVINQVMLDDEGLVYLLDIQLVEIQVFDQEGQWVRSLAKRGDGPGELRFVTDAMLLADGTIGLAQPFPGRIVKVDYAGLPAGEIKPGGGDPTAGGFFAIHAVAATAQNENMIISGVKITRSDNKREALHFIGLYHPDGTAGPRYLEQTRYGSFRKQKIVEKDEFFPHVQGWALAADGRVAVAPERNRYRVDIHAPSGEIQRTLTREYTSTKRTAAEKKTAAAMMMPWRRRNRHKIDFVMEDTEPDIIQMHFSDDGYLWVLTSAGVRHQESGVHSTWDVFDGQGEFARQVSIVCDADGLSDTLFFPGKDIVVLIKQHRDALQAFQGRGMIDEASAPEEFEAPPLEVICYRIASGLTAPAE